MPVIYHTFKNRSNDRKTREGGVTREKVNVKKNSSHQNFVQKNLVKIKKNPKNNKTQQKTASKQ